MSSTSFQMDKTFWGVGSSAVQQSRRKANMVAQGDGKSGPWGWPQDPSKQTKKHLNDMELPFLNVVIILENFDMWVHDH